uniref:Uncharacterized protein n=1 Tax=Aegilops tauschii subsp. strangulata TaxID=200361 RepID=A0A453EMI7_AEGTS
MQVEKIPTTFHSSEQYLTSFKKPLIEEVRSEIKSSLKSISTSEYYKLLGILPVHVGDSSSKEMHVNTSYAYLMDTSSKVSKLKSVLM